MKTIVNTYIGAYGIIVKNEQIALIKKAGGGIEHTELPEEALKRELMEEANVEVLKYNLFDVTATNIVWKIKPNLEEDLHHIGILYTVATLSDDLKEDGDGRDSNGTKWYQIKDLKKEVLSPFATYALEKLGYKL